MKNRSSFVLQILLVIAREDTNDELHWNGRFSDINESIHTTDELHPGHTDMDNVPSKSMLGELISKGTLSGTFHNRLRHDKFVRSFTKCANSGNGCWAMRFAFECSDSICRITPQKLEGWIGDTDQIQPSENTIFIDPMVPQGWQSADQGRRDNRQDFFPPLATDKGSQRLPPVSVLLSVRRETPSSVGGVDAGQTANFYHPVVGTAENEPESESRDDQSKSGFLHSNVGKLSNAAKTLAEYTLEQGSGKQNYFPTWWRQSSGLPSAVSGAASSESYPVLNATEYLESLPTLRPTSFGPGAEAEGSFGSLLSRVRLPVSIRAVTSGMELLRAFQSKTIEFMLSTIRAPLSVGSAFIEPLPVDSAIPNAPFPFEDSSLKDSINAAEILANVQTSSWLQDILGQQANLYPQVGNVDSFINDVAGEWDRVSPSLNRMIARFDPPIKPEPTGSTTDDSQSRDRHKDFVTVDDRTSSDWLPWLPMDSVAGGLPEWLTEAMVGPYAALFQNLAKVAKDGLIRMQLMFDSLAVEPIPVTSEELGTFTDKVAHAFRSSLVGDEADALKAIAVTIEQLPNFMDSEPPGNDTEQRPGGRRNFIDRYEVFKKERRSRNKTEVADDDNDDGVEKHKSDEMKFLGDNRDRTSTEDLPWKPLDAIVADLPGFFSGKLGKPGAFIKRAASLWLEGAEGLDAATKSVIDPLIELSGGVGAFSKLSDPKTRREQDSEDGEWHASRPNYRFDPRSEEGKSENWFDSSDWLETSRWTCQKNSDGSDSENCVREPNWDIWEKDRNDYHDIETHNLLYSRGSSSVANLGVSGANKFDEEIFDEPCPPNTHTVWSRLLSPECYSDDIEQVLQSLTELSEAPLMLNKASTNIVPELPWLTNQIFSLPAGGPAYHFPVLSTEMLGHALELSLREFQAQKAFAVHVTPDDTVDPSIINTPWLEGIHPIPLLSLEEVWAYHQRIKDDMERFILYNYGFQAEPESIAN